MVMGVVEVEVERGREGKEGRNGVRWSERSEGKS